MLKSSMLICFSFALACSRSTSNDNALMPIPFAAPCTEFTTIVKGDTFEALTRRCYGSRTYQHWVMAFNHHDSRLAEGEVMHTPDFETLAASQVSPQRRALVSKIARAYFRFASVEARITPGKHPATDDHRQLVAAASELDGVMKEVSAQGFRTTQLSAASAQLVALAQGGGGSPDYATEEVHQRLALSVDALK
jgi:hypothetical protein